MRTLFLSLACAAALGAASPAAAVVVAPGDQGFLTGTTAAARPDLAGTVIADITTAYSITISDLGRTATGQVQSRVVRTGAGTLDFYWRIIPDARSQLDVAIFAVDPWTGFAVDTDYRTDGLGDYGATKFINSGAVPFAYDIAWYFDAPSADAETYFFFARTDAHNFALTSEFQIAVTGQPPGGGVDYVQFTSGATFAPAAGGGVPEPATWGLMIAGFGLAGLALRRRAAMV